MSKPNIAPKAQTAGFMIFSSLMLLILTTVVLALFLNRFEIQDEAVTAPTRRIQDLVTLLRQAENKRTTLETEVSQLRKRIVEAENRQEQNLNAQKSPSDPELQKLYQLAGFTPISGNGLVITLQDNTSAHTPSDPHADPNSGKVQAEDILKLVNELKAAGARAVSINDQRLIVTSEIITAGPSILVNQTPLSQPISIKAVGDSEVLLSALKIRGGILEYLDFFNIKVNIEKKENITVPAYKGSISM